MTFTKSQLLNISKYTCKRVYATMAHTEVYEQLENGKIEETITKMVAEEYSNFYPQMSADEINHIILVTQQLIAKEIKNSYWKLAL